MQEQQDPPTNPVEIDGRLIMQSLREQVANLAFELATRDAMVKQMQQQWQEEKSVMQAMLDASMAEIERLRQVADPTTTKEEDSNGRDAKVS